MNGQWREVPAPPPYLEGYAWAGLIIVDAYDADAGCFWPGHYEIRHQASGEVMIDIEAELARVQEIATDLAGVADWASMSTTDETMLQAKLMAFGAGYPGEVSVFNDWTMPDELERIIPYGR